MFPRANRYVFIAAIAISGLSAFGDAVSTDRLHQLAPSDRPAWEAYLRRSQAAALADQAALDAEVAASKLPQARQAPDGGDFKLSARLGDAWYGSDEARQLADAVLSYQSPAGGWSKHVGYSKGPRSLGMQWTSQNEPGRPAHYLGTFDNRSTTEQLYFLAQMWQATHRNDCKAGFMKGLNYVFAAQYPNGGWPQVYPLEGGYHDDITFNDDAMTHILELLHAIARNEPRFDFLDESQRTKASQAFTAGIDCVLRLQIRHDGKQTAWCAQYDPLTLRPTSARKMEPATLSGLESARLLKFLMTIPDPQSDVVASIEAGLQWLECTKVTGVGTTKENGKTIYVSDSSSTQVYWARFYDLTSGKPVFPGRDGVLYESFAAMAAKNDLGYDYYTTLPGSILSKGQKKWRNHLKSQAKK